MTDNEILARWQGLRDCRGSKHRKSKWKRPLGNNVFDYIDLPDYLNNDAAAMSLLDTLVEKGYTYQLLESFRVLPDTKVQHRLRFGKQGKENLCGMVAIGGLKPTRREAIIAACLEVARKDQDHGKG